MLSAPANVHIECYPRPRRRRMPSWLAAARAGAEAIRLLSVTSPAPAFLLAAYVTIECVRCLARREGLNT